MPNCLFNHPSLFTMPPCFPSTYCFCCAFVALPVLWEDTSNIRIMMWLGLYFFFLPLQLPAAKVSRSWKELAHRGGAYCLVCSAAVQWFAENPGKTGFQEVKGVGSVWVHPGACTAIYSTSLENAQATIFSELGMGYLWGAVHCSCVSVLCV